MIASQIVQISDVYGAQRELDELGLTRQEISDIARQVAAARAEVLAVDPCNAAGMQAYIAGVRAIRLQLQPKGWRIDRHNNVESTVNDDLGIQLIFQSVELACAEQDPQPISEKGSGTCELVELGRQGELFGNQDSPAPTMLGVMPEVWMICVSTAGDRLRAEVSCPRVFENGRFAGFDRRIFVLDEELGANLSEDTIENYEDGDDQIEIRIAKK